MSSSRSVRIAALASSVLLALSACSGSDDADAPSDDPPVTAQVDGSPDATVPADGGTSVAVETPDDAPDDEADPSDDACAGLSAADVAAASGVAGIADVDDISVDVDVTCLFSVPAATDAISIGSQSVGDFLGGELADATPADALATLASTRELVLTEVTSSEQVDVGGVTALVIVGSSPTGGSVGYAAAIVDGSLVEVDASGAGIAPDPASLATVVIDVLDLALAAR